MFGLECPIIWATKRGETPAWVRRLAKVCLRSYSQKYSSPAAFKASDQAVRTSLRWVFGSCGFAKTYSENFGPSRSRHLSNSELQRLDIGTLRIPFTFTIVCGSGLL